MSKYNWPSEEELMEIDFGDINKKWNAEIPEFKIDDIITITSIWRGGINYRVYRGEEGKITEIFHKSPENGGGFDYGVEFGKKIGILEEEELEKFKKEI